MKKLLVLAAIGVAIKYFLDSDSGKEAKDQVKSWLGDAKDYFDDYMKTAADKVQKVANNGRIA